MSYAATVVQRSELDITRLMRVARRRTLLVSGKVRARLIEEFKSGRKIDLKQYIVSQLAPLLGLTMLAGHLAGYKRSFLTVKQVPGLLRKLQEIESQKQPLQLAALDEAVSVLQQRAGLDIRALQEQYNSTALMVWNGASDNIESELRKTLEDLVLKGAHVKEGIRTLGEKFQELGLSPQKDYKLEAIFRTQTQLAFGAGKWQAEQDSDIQEILWGYKYVSVGDDRVRPEHAALEGVTLPKDNPFWQRFYPPNGWNCRCYAIPVFEEREIVNPPDADANGNPIAPDKGFAFNPGEVFKAPAPRVDPPKPKPVVVPVAKPVVEDVKAITNLAPIDELNESLDNIKSELDSNNVYSELEKVHNKYEQQAKDKQQQIERLNGEREKLYSDFAKQMEALKDNPLKGDYSLSVDPRYFEAGREIAALQKSLNSIEDRRRTAAFKVLKAENPVSVNQVAVPNRTNFGRLGELVKQRDLTASDDDKLKVVIPEKSIVAKAKEVFKDLSPLMSRDKFAADSVDDKMQTTLYGTERNCGRSFAMLNSLFMHKSETRAEVFAHELGHTLETRGEYSQKLNAFIAKRTGDEKPSSLRELFGNGFREDETGRQDDWLKTIAAVYGPGRNASSAYYIGKQYGDGQSEVLSMGLELLYKNPTAFAKSDPEFFSLVIGALRGKL